MQATGIQGLRSGAAASSSRGAQRAAFGVARRERRRERASTRASALAVTDRQVASVHKTLPRELAQRSANELRAGQEGLARLVTQLEAGGKGVAGNEMFAGLQEVRGRLDRLADELRVAGQPCDESSSSSSSEDECTDAEAAARMEAKAAKKAAKALEKAAKKEAKAADKAAKAAAKAARAAAEAALLGPAAAEQPEPLFREGAPPLVVTAAAAPGAEPAPAATLEAGSGLGAAGGAAAPARGALVLRTMRGDMVLDGGDAGGAPAPAVRVEVCQGKACARRGAGALLEALGGALAGDAGVAVPGCKCMDQCKAGPNLRVRVAGQAPVVAVGVPPGGGAAALRRVA